MEPLNLPFQIKNGIDLVYMPRFEKFLDNSQFLSKVLTENERKIYDSLNHPKRQLEFLCGRYACKEAYAKAQGTGIGLTDFQDIEILRDNLGAPHCTQAQVSISHDGDYVVAQVVIYYAIS